MTPEHVFMFAKSYKLYLAGDKYDFIKYQGHTKTPALITQRDRQFYYRLSTKLNDEQIHATFLTGYFFKPTAYIADFCTPDAMDAGVRFASRAENGLPFLANELYEVRKRVPLSELYTWLYASEHTTVPGCIEAVISKELPLDLAALLLLIPQPDYGLHWTAYWDAGESNFANFGVRPWVQRLRKVDQLLHWRRSQWRQHSYKLAQRFWASYQVASLAPALPEHVLF